MLKEIKRPTEQAIKMNDIEKYLANRMTDTERQAFEQQLAVDPSLQKELREQALCEQAIQGVEAEALLEKIKSWDKPGGRLLRFPKPIRWAMTAAAAIALLLVLKTDSSSDPNVFDSYFSPYPNVASTVVRGEQPDTDFHHAMALYEQGAYELAIERLAKLEEPKEWLSFYLGMSQLASGHAEAAIASFEAVDNPRLAEQKQWYLALSLLKAGEEKMAISVLNEVSSSSAYAQKSEQLLEKLKKE